MRQFTLKQGDRGLVVRRLQLALGLKVDGDYGPKTAAAVKAWQLRYDLTADGVAGFYTLNSLGIRIRTGIDVSHYQGKIDWAAVKAAGVEWACVKVSQGNGGTDSRAAENLAGARAAGLDVRAYHFAVPDAARGDAVAEAAAAVRLADGAPLVLDLEQTGGLNGAALGTWTATFLAEVERLQGSVPWLYTTVDYLRNRLGNVDLSHYPLWVSRVNGKSDPDSPRDWVAWQWSWKGTVPGIAGEVDLDWVLS